MLPGQDTQQAYITAQVTYHSVKDKKNLMPPNFSPLSSCHNTVMPVRADGHDGIYQVSK